MQRYRAKHPSKSAKRFLSTIAFGEGEMERQAVLGKAPPITIDLGSVPV